MFSSFSMSKPSLRSVSMQISTLRSFVYVDCERREATHVPAVERRRHVLAIGSEQPVEPPLAQLGPALVDGGARCGERPLELAQRHLLLLLVACDVLALASQLRLERLALRLQLRACLVERRRHVRLQCAELRAVGVRVEHGELRLRTPQRHLLALPRDARGEDLVLELVLCLGELSGGETSFARLAEAVEPLALVAVRGLLLALAERRRAARARRGRRTGRRSPPAPKSPSPPHGPRGLPRNARRGISAAAPRTRPGSALSQ